MNLIHINNFERFMPIKFKGADETDNRGTGDFTVKSSNRVNEIDRMNIESERLKTFECFPIDFMDKYKLAKTGMYYTGQDDKCICYFCFVEIGRWERNDCPVGEHQKFSPNCPLLRRRQTDNVPLNIDELNAILPEVSYDVCGSTIRVPAPIEAPLLYTNNQGDVPPTSATTTTPATSYYPDHPEYAVISARLRSYTDWPRTLKQKPAELAEAGFFYTGTGDKVKCFSCGGGLKDWDDTDEPWEQHALWLSTCRFLKVVKGEAYIKSVNEKFANSKNEQPTSSTASTSSSSNQCNNNNPKSSLSNITTSRKTESETATTSSCSTEVTTISSENEETSKPVSEDRLCKICYSAEYNTLFLPCGHVVACATCAMSVTKCPLCRKPFTNVVRAYFS